MDRPSRRLSGGSPSGKGSERQRPGGGSGDAGERGKSGSGVRRDSPSGVRRDSPSGVRRDSPSGVRRDPPSSARRESPSGIRRDSPSGVRKEAPSSGLRRPAPAEPDRRTSGSDARRKATSAPVAPSRPSSSRIRGAGKPHVPNPVETAANANPMYAGSNRARARRGSADKSNPMLFVYIGLGVLALGGLGFVAFGGKKGAGPATGVSTVSADTPRTPGISLVVTNVLWTTQAEGVWTVSGAVENRGDTAAERVVVAFYPCGEEPRIKDKNGDPIAIVTHARIPRVGPGEKVPFGTQRNPPAIQPDGMATFPENKSNYFVSCQGGPSLPLPIQQAIFDPLDMDDWGGEETEWAKKRKRGSGAK